MKVAERIGREKRKLNLPIEDLEVEQKVRLRMRQLDLSLKIEGCGDDLADFLMSCAKKVQTDQRKRLNTLTDSDDQMM